MQDQDQKLLELCSWDFLSYDEAVSIGVAHYKLEVVPDSNDVFLGKNKIEVRRSILGFGFYRWIPVEPKFNVLTSKSKPNLWTDYVPVNKDLVNLVCSTVESVANYYGFMVGVTCIGCTRPSFDDQYLIAFAEMHFSIPALAIKFSISEYEFTRLQQQNRQAEYLLSLGEVIVDKARRAAKNDIKNIE